jgi:hypothetical protein
VDENFSLNARYAEASPKIRRRRTWQAEMVKRLQSHAFGYFCKIEKVLVNRAAQRAGAVAEEEDTGAAAHLADAQIKLIVLLCGTGAVVRLEAA